MPQEHRGCPGSTEGALAAAAHGCCSPAQVLMASQHCCAAAGLGVQRELGCGKEPISDGTRPFMLSDIKFHAEY